jgi:hypothetical protein
MLIVTLGAEDLSPVALGSMVQVSLVPAELEYLQAVVVAAEWFAVGG